MTLQKTTVSFINEFSSREGPVASLVDDIRCHLRKSGHETRLISCAGRYRTGGIAPDRVSNLLWMHLTVPLRLLMTKILSTFSQVKPTIVVTTSPPLLHLTVSLFCRVFRIRSIVWYMDAHPELEASILENRSFRKFAVFLRQIDQYLLAKASKIITLDEGMKNFVTRRSGNSVVTKIVSPWITYVHPPKPFRVFKGKSKVKLLYAGNFGAAHDLSEILDVLSNLSIEHRSRLEFTFVGMKKNVFLKIKDDLLPYKVEINFKDRFAEFKDLLNYFESFDFGIVTLDQGYKGLASPSKIYTYLSQGVPIIYSGPKDSLGGEVVKAGWGIYANHNNFLDILNGKTLPVEERTGQIFPDPRPDMLELIAKEILR